MYLQFYHGLSDTDKGCEAWNVCLKCFKVHLRHSPCDKHSSTGTRRSRTADIFTGDSHSFLSRASVFHTHTHTQTHTDPKQAQTEGQEVSASSPQWDRSSAKEMRPLDLWIDELARVENDDVFLLSCRVGDECFDEVLGSPVREYQRCDARPLCGKSIQQVQSI